MSTPAPEITSLATYEQGWDQWPQGVRTFIRTAESHGWDVRTGFSRGWRPGRAADSWELTDLIGVWVRGYSQRAVCWWARKPEADTQSGQTWSVDATAIWTGASPMPFPYASVTDLMFWLAEYGNVRSEFYDFSRAAFLARREKARSRPASAPKEREHA